MAGCLFSGSEEQLCVALGDRFPGRRPCAVSSASAPIRSAMTLGASWQCLRCIWLALATVTVRISIQPSEPHAREPQAKTCSLSSCGLLLTDRSLRKTRFASDRGRTSRRILRLRHIGSPIHHVRLFRRKSCLGPCARKARLRRNWPNPATLPCHGNGRALDRDALTTVSMTTGGLTTFFSVSQPNGCGTGSMSAFGFRTRKPPVRIPPQCNHPVAADRKAGFGAWISNPNGRDVEGFRARERTKS